jgi:ectoine hydroxylase-related dioxygenase (phytanoyl-CoA dioxygenase family)
MRIPRLPPCTSDWQQVYEDLKLHGVSLVANALSASELKTARTRLAEQAESERLEGRAFLEDGSSSDGHYVTGPEQPNQRVLNLISKGEIFRMIAERAEPLALIQRVFAETYAYPEDAIRRYELDDVLISSMSANIAGPGGLPMTLHADQGFTPNTTPYPIIINALYLLSDFREENGATRIAPDTHDAGLHGGFFTEPPATLPAEAPAGTLLLFDGRTWHGTGANQTDEPRSALLVTFCRPWVRQIENFGLSLDNAILKTCSPTLRRLLGFKRWSVFGMVETRRVNTAGLTG